MSAAELLTYEQAGELLGLCSRSVKRLAELGRVLEDIANAEAEVTTANERVKLAKEHVNVLNEKHREISRVVSSGEEERSRRDHEPHP